MLSMHQEMITMEIRLLNHKVQRRSATALSKPCPGSDIRSIWDQALDNGFKNMHYSYMIDLGIGRVREFEGLENY